MGWYERPCVVTEYICFDYVTRKGRVVRLHTINTPDYGLCSVDHLSTFDAFALIYSRFSLKLCTGLACTRPRYTAREPLSRRGFPGCHNISGSRVRRE
jgi:hypothetical protein